MDWKREREPSLFDKEMRVSERGVRWVSVLAGRHAIADLYQEMFLKAMTASAT